MNEIAETKRKFPILIIDDEIGHLKTLSDLLELEDLDPITCRTGQEALLACQKQTINVAVSDLHLPDINGVDLLRQLKVGNPDIKVIINTAYASLESAIDAINEEAFAYVRKMGDVEELLTHIHRAFHTHLAQYSEALEAEVNKRTVALLTANQKLKSEIAEREQTQKELFQREQEVRALVENSPDIVIRFDKKMRPVYINPAVEQLVGIPPQKLIGKTYQELDIPPEITIFWIKTLKRIFTTGQEDVIYFDLPISHKVRYFESRVAPEFAKDGSVETVLVLARDITDRKQLESQLLQSQKMEAIGQLAGGIAHDFNNLLTIIGGHTEFLLEEWVTKDDGICTDLEQIRKAGNRATLLTRQLLAFSRKQVLQPKIVNLNEIITDVEKMLRRLLVENINLIISLDPQLKPIKADAGQLEQVVMNLAINGRDAMPKGGDLTIKTTNVKLNTALIGPDFEIEPGSYILLTVTDVGMGMSANTQSHIFEPFFTTKQMGHGTGLGLATVYGIVQQSGGHISISSKLGKGTTFKIYIPQIEATNQNIEPIKTHTTPSIGEETILVVEDEADIRLVTRKILQKSGYTVLEAAHADEALHLCQQHQGSIHLLVTDVVMPDMNGPQLAERMARIQPMPVLYISGYADDIIEQYGLLESDIALVSKPFTMETLTRKVREVLDSSLLKIGKS